MSNLFVKVFRDKVEEIMPVTFDFANLNSGDVGKRLTIEQDGSGGGFKIVAATDVDFDGSYSSLSGTPSFHPVATSGDYNDLGNLPTLFDGDYSNLTNVPTFFDGQWSSIQNKPGLIELPTGTPAEGSIAVFQAGVSGGPGQWVLRQRHELESIYSYAPTSTGASIDMSSGPALAATTVILEPNASTAANFSVQISNSTVEEGRIVRWHFSHSAPTSLETIFLQAGSINGLGQIELKRNATVSLQCINKSSGKFIVV